MLGQLGLLEIEKQLLGDGGVDYLMELIQRLENEADRATARATRLNGDEARLAMISVECLWAARRILKRTLRII
ncbi:hypothetical protein [Paraburkholderia hayleyella]|uniref:hypothetical protein n=1 Tax=Paraburkholderia hayleyella TaxID=2152889 RepID=UPI00158057CB|nr:hypothetical protein [Paraburkholderia hayleyella]